MEASVTSNATAMRNATAPPADRVARANRIHIPTTGTTGAVTSTAGAARTLALSGGVPGSLGESVAWIAGILAVFVPLSVWRYRRMS